MTADKRRWTRIKNRAGSICSCQVAAERRRVFQWVMFRMRLLTGNNFISNLLARWKLNPGPPENIGRAGQELGGSNG